VGLGGEIAVGAGEDWTHEQVPGVFSFKSAVEREDGTLLAAGDPGLLWWDRDGGAFLLQQAGIYPLDLALTPGGALWLSGVGGLLMYWESLPGSPGIVSVTEQSLLGVAVGEDGAMRAVGRGGTIVAGEPEPPAARY
jgi:hypothetical protein